MRNTMQAKSAPSGAIERSLVIEVSINVEPRRGSVMVTTIDDTTTDRLRRSYNKGMYSCHQAARSCSFVASPLAWCFASYGISDA